MVVIIPTDNTEGIYNCFVINHLCNGALYPNYYN